MEKLKVVSLVMNNFKQDFRVLKEAKTLNKAGYHVTVVALHDGYSSLPVHEDVKGITVERILLCSKNWPKNKCIQGIKYLEYMLKAIWKSRKADIVHCNDVEPLIISMIIKLFSFGRVKVVYDAHELEFDKNGITNFGKKIIEFQETFFLKFIDAFITVSEGIATLYKNKYGIEKLFLILNCPPLQLKKNSTKFRDKFNLKSDIVIFLYQGRLAKGRGIEQTIKAFQQINRDDVALIFIGEGELKNYIKGIAVKEKNIYIHEAVAPEVLYQYTNSADVGLCFIEDICKSYYYCLPNKLFEYIQAGLPVICSNLPELRKVINEENLGIIMEENDVQGMIKAIEKMMSYKQQGFLDFKMGVERASKNYCWENQEKTLLEIYEKVFKR